MPLNMRVLQNYMMNFEKNNKVSFVGSIQIFPWRNHALIFFCCTPI